VAVLQVEFKVAVSILVAEKQTDGQPDITTIQGALSNFNVFNAATEKERAE
jgi:hypothetical protein